MDINAFSDQIVTYILPYVFKATIVGGKKVVEKLGEIGGDSIADVAKEIWRKIVKRYGKDKKIKNATNVLKDDPNDGGAQMTLKNGLAACLAKEPTFAMELMKMMETVNVTQQAFVTDSIQVHIEQKSSGKSDQVARVKNSDDVIIRQKKQ